MTNLPNGLSKADFRWRGYEGALDEDGLPVDWLFDGQPCEIAAIGFMADGGLPCAMVLFVDGEEVCCYQSAPGEFPEIQSA